MKKVIFSAVIIGVLLGALDLVGSSVHAENLTMSATINSSATISLSSAVVDLNITPSENGTLGKSSPLVVSTYTNSNYDCAVTMTTSSTQLTHSTDSTASIASLASGSTYTDSTFQNDRWGYAIGTGNYNPVATGSGANPITTVSTNTGSSAVTTNIYFAAKLTPATKPGTYSNTVTFASTCTPPPRNYMQDQTAASLAELMPDEFSEAILYDKRDEQEYTVAKVEDGNYWMTKNLNLAGGTTLTSALSNVSSDYTLPASSNTGTSFSDDSVAYVYNSGSTACDGSDPCYSYYSYIAATAGTNPSSGNATYDICPKGWRLPTDSDFGTLGDIVGWYGGGFESSALSASYGGFYSYSNSSVQFVGSGNMAYWSSTAVDYNNNWALALLLDPVEDGSMGTAGKAVGVPVRCLFNS